MKQHEKQVEKKEKNFSKKIQKIRVLKKICYTFFLLMTLGIVLDYFIIDLFMFSMS